MTREENDSVVEAFLGRHKDFQVEDLRFIVPESWQPLVDEKGFLRTYPEMIILRENYRLDGFFAARMKKGI
jgi:16S rRNA C967 or C1407 C5-methylase (RsmB/RsmF family)